MPVIPETEQWIIGARPDCDVVVDAPEVSGRHCKLTRTGADYIVEDLGSTNGTFVHGKKISGPTPVRMHDDIKLGLYRPLPWTQLQSGKTGAARSAANSPDRLNPNASSAMRSRSMGSKSPAPKPPKNTKKLLAMVALMATVSIAGIVASRKGDSPGEDEPFGRFAEHQGALRSLTIGADGRRAVSVSENGELLTWDVPSARLLRRFDGVVGKVRKAALSSDDRTIAAGCADGTVRLLKSETGESVADVGQGTGELVNVGFSATGAHVFSVLADGEIKIWKVSDKTLERQIHNGESIRSFALAPDARSFVTGGERGGIRYWRVRAERPEREIRGHSGPVRAVAISADAKWAASAGDDATVALWNLETGQRSVVMSGPSEAAHQINALAFSPGGTRIVGAAVDGGVCVWTTEDGSLLHAFGTGKGTANVVGILPNSIVVVGGFENGEVFQWRTKPPTATERKIADSLAESFTDRGRRLKDFADQISEGKKRIDEKEFDAAVACFEAASRFADPDSLEGLLAQDARRRADELRRYTATLREGEQLAKADRPDEARKKFDRARQILPDRREAVDALKRADNASALKRALDGAHPKAKLSFDFDADRGNLLDRGNDFAVLVLDKSGKTPALGLGVSPIQWKFVLRLAARLPEIDVRLRVELYRHDGRRLGGKDTLLDPKLMDHEIEGSSKPDGEWKAGEYEIRLHLVTEDGVKENIIAPVVFPLTMIHWQKERIVLKPRQVLESRFEVRTGVRLENGDGFRIRANGKIDPAPAEFYRDIFGGKNLERRKSGPEGFPQAIASARMGRYWLVANHLPAAALLWRIVGAGEKPQWQPYTEDKRIPPAIVESDGEVVLSINSVAQLPNGRDGQPQVVKDDKYWQANSGDFKVDVLRASFASPLALDRPARVFLLMPFKE